MDSSEMCHKKAYSSKRLAQTVKNNRMSGNKRKGRPRDLRVYYCEDCAGWHLATVEYQNRRHYPDIRRSYESE